MPDIPSDMNNVSVPKANTAQQSGQQPSGASNSQTENQQTQSTESSSQSGSSKSSETSSQTGSGNSLSASGSSDNPLSASGSPAGMKAITSGEKKEKLSDKVSDSVSEATAADNAEQMVEQEERAQEKQQRSIRKAFKAGMVMAPPLAQAGVLALILYRLKAFAMGLLQAAMALGQSIASMFSSIVSAVTSFVSTVATALGVGFTAAATLLGGGSVVAVTAVIMSVVVLVNSSIAGRDGSLVTSKPDCSTEVIAAVEDVDADARALENAKKLYSCLHELGIPDINIAAVIGNFSVESGLDSTKVEGFYGNNEAYTIGEKKSAILSDTEAMNEYCRQLFADYDSGGVSYSADGYLIDGTNYQCGVGMAQWTGSSAKPLFNKANALNVDWWDFDFQMAYVLSQPAPTSSSVFADGVVGWTEPAESVEEAALYFAENYEGNTVNGQEERVMKSEYYYNLIITEWNVSVTDKIGNAILGFIKKLGTAVENAIAVAATDDCVMPTKTSIADTGTGQLGYPVTMINITATYPYYASGAYHSGVDFSVSVGTDVYAAADGEVIVSKDLNSSYGRYIIIKHSDNLYTLYAHNSRRLVEVGDTVVRGERIAKSGATGNVTGPHVHFEVRSPGATYSSCVDPMTYLSESSDEEDTSQAA